MPRDTQRQPVRGGLGHLRSACWCPQVWLKVQRLASSVLYPPNLVSGWSRESCRLPPLGNAAWILLAQQGQGFTPRAASGLFLVSPTPNIYFRLAVLGKTFSTLFSSGNSRPCRVPEAAGSTPACTGGCVDGGRSCGRSRAAHVADVPRQS